MIDEYIDLTLKEHSQHNDKSYLLEEAIRDHEIVVLLGTPGSGKTSILRKYKNEHPNTQVLEIRKFLELNIKAKGKTKVMLLDGLDEYRSVNNYKAFVVTKLGDRIKKLKRIKIVISCREMDWYGEIDSKALKDEINKKAVIFRVCPLDYKQKKQMAKLLDIKDAQKFIKKYSKYGFLDNPQTFKMLAEIYKNNPKDTIKSKTDLYLKFVGIAREQNPSYKQNKINGLEGDEILKYAGYIAFFYLFSDIEILNGNFLDKICDGEHGYPKEKLEIVLKTNLFGKRIFIHRTVAEFLLAYYIHKYKLEKGQPIAVERIKNIFMKKVKVPTVLRGTYAWLCSLTGSEELIKVDPYYQAIHGDNSLFNNDLKTKIVLEVKKYAKKNPYFIDFRQSMELEGFYNEELDSFLINEFKEALSFKNHYIYFIINAIISKSELSPGMKMFLKEKILDNEIQSYYKSNIINAFQNDIDFLVEVLERIKNDQIPDDSDTLKDTLLRILYPAHINFNRITDYLILYKKRVGGYCYYLYNTDYNNKFVLIDNIYKASYDEARNPKLVLPANVEGFVEDYFLETLIEFENSLTSKDIYDFIKHFKKYSKSYEHLKFNSFRYDITDKLKNSDEKLTRLANELFSLFVDDMLKENDENARFYNFNDFFDYKSPNNQSNILFGKMNSSRSPESNKNLFQNALRYLQKDELYSEKLNSIVEDFGLEQELNDWLHPKKQEWEIQREKTEKERERKAEKLIVDNEKYFAEETNEQIQGNFGDLDFITNLLFIENSSEKERCLINETFKRLKGILKDAIISKLIRPELLTLKSLASNSPEAGRKIDNVYYVSCALNDYSDIKKIIDEEFLKYLYIITLMYNRSSNVIKGNLIEGIETMRLEFSRSVLIEYTKLLFEFYFPLKKQTFLFYTEKEKEIGNLKKIILLFKSGKDTIPDVILNNFLKVYSFGIKLEDIKLLEELTTVNNKNKIIITALKMFLVDKKEKFTINMAIAIYSLIIKDNLNYFRQIESNYKIKIIDYLMSQFNTIESIQHVNGFQSDKEQCASFLTNLALGYFDLDSLYKLKKLHINEDDIWTYRIAYAIDKLNQKESDKLYTLYPIERIKSFIVSDAIVSKDDFFADICLRLNNLKTKIEDNRDNDKEPFHNQDGTNKNEEACRDVIFHRLKDKYGDDLQLTKEKHEADNRVDINIKYRADNSFEVQIECKINDNSAINTGISKQLIEKYFSSGVQFGIYLIFYFGGKKDKNKLLEKVDKNIPEEYKNKIKIVCIDLTFPGK